MGKKERKPEDIILTVTIHDCEVQTFRSGGKGGQNQNKRDTGVRVIHHPSGARGESREQRSQLQNKQEAFRKMASSATFRAWVYAVTRNLKTPNEQYAEWDQPQNYQIEVKESKNKWKTVTESELD